MFETYHPAVAFAYLACCIALSMAALQPVYVVLSLAGALVCACVTRGPRAAARSLAWALPLVALVTVANPLFSASGSTEILRLGSRAVYAESLFYGACSGGMLASVLVWFASYAACMTSENSMALFGNVAPVLVTMVSQVLRLVPQFVSRGRGIAAVQDAASSAAPRGRREQARDRMRTVSVLMGWGMEDGLVRSDAMRARGYGCGVRRTSYRRFRLKTADVAALAFVLALAVLNVPLVALACGQYAFYPTLSVLVVWWGYLPYAVLMAVPAVLAAKEAWQWRSSR